MRRGLSNPSPNQRRRRTMTHDGASGLTHHPVVSHEEWLAARTTFLAREKEFTRLRDELSEERRRLPWEAVTKPYVFRAPQAALAAYQKRMGWTFPWFSSGDTDFNRDYQVSFTAEEVAQKRAYYNYTTQDPSLSEREGVIVFYKDPAGRVFHCYSAYARGIDLRTAAYNYLDLVPKGRDEGGRG